MQKNFCSNCPAAIAPNPVQYFGSQFFCIPKTEITLCHVLDKRTIELIFLDNPATFFEFSDFVRFGFHIEHNGSQLQRSISNKKIYKPSSEKGFLISLRRMHEKLFRGIPFKDLGQFRKDRVWFGTNNNMYEGVDPNDVEKALKALWNDLLEPYLKKKTLTKDDLTFLCASFFSHFFRIHPFRDGNGRIARSFVKLIMFHYGYEILYKHPRGKTEARYTRRYVKALKYSHSKFYRIYSVNSYVSIPELKRINKYMISFLDELISVRVPDTAIEIEPSNIKTRTLFEIIRKLLGR